MVLFGTGHYCEGDFCDLESFVSVLNSGSPIIFYMALNKLVKLAQRLIDHHVSSDIKIQILSRVSQSDSSVIEGTLGNIAQILEIKKPIMPALVMIGKYVERLSG
jgi:siroheme synthase